MTEWTVVGVIGVLLTMGAAIICPIVKLNSTITILNEAEQNLKSNIEDIVERNSDSHARLWKKCEEHDDKINDHETRICLIEKK